MLRDICSHLLGQKSDDQPCHVLCHFDFDYVGTWMQVHIIEARDLRPQRHSLSHRGVCDPFVCVEMLGQRRYTAVKPRRNDAVFDQASAIMGDGTRTGGGRLVT